MLVREFPVEPESNVQRHKKSKQLSYDSVGKFAPHSPDGPPPSTFLMVGGRPENGHFAPHDIDNSSNSGTYVRAGTSSGTDDVDRWLTIDHKNSSDTHRDDSIHVTSKRTIEQVYIYICKYMSICI
jgi:hypothetical protein